MKKARGLSFATRIGDRLVAIGQRRGPYKRGEGGVLVPESYAGGVQVTFAGRMEDQDDNNNFACLLREGTEEVGETFARMVLDKYHSFQVVGEKKTADQENVTYMLYLPGGMDLIERIQWHVLSGGIAPIYPGDAIHLLDKSMKEPGVPNDGKAYMFDDERAAVYRTLELAALASIT